jgi:3-oxoacyl-[acyl-carrier protein] reductase
MKIALITGGSGGIGAAIAEALAQEGLHVIVHANSNLDRANSIVNRICKNGGSAESVCFDLLDQSAVQGFIDVQLERGGVDILINNAGIHDDAVFPGMSADQWHRVIDVNLDGFFNITQPLVMPMIRKRWGRIVNISSISGITGNRGQVNYSAAKGAIHAATKALSLELASRGITVNAVAPGIINTAMTEGVFDPEAIKSLVPMKRAGTPDEVADLVAFLVSEKAAYITGQIISINGGMI